MEDIEFKIINTERIWKEYKDKTENISVTDTITLERDEIYEFSDDVFEDKTLKIKDVDIDECGIVYLLDEKKIIIYDKISRVRKDIEYKTGFPSITFESPSGIGVDSDTIYIADSAQDHGKIIAIARSNFQKRWTISDIEGRKLGELTDLVKGRDGNIYVLEGVSEKDSNGGKVLKISKKGFIELDFPLKKLSKPTDLEVDKDGKIYVLAEIQSSTENDKTKKFGVWIFGKDGEQEKPGKDGEPSINIPAEILPDGSSPKGLAVDDKKNVFVGISGDEDENRIIYRLDNSKQNSPLTPIWSYRSAIRKLITDRAGNLYAINFKGNKLSFLEYNKKRIKQTSGLFSGFYYSKPINSNDPKTRWHRVLLKGDFKKGTQVEFSYYVSDKENIVDYNNFTKGLSGTSSSQGEKERDFLFQGDIRGQYLRFQVTLTGTENISPVVNSITIFFPRNSYLNYLPAVYQDDPSSKDFLERFLSIFESIFYEIDLKIEHLSLFFDAWGAPPDFIPWLGSWLSIPLNEDFPEKMKRLYIYKAILLYKKRGTREGLEEAIAFFIYTKKNPDKSFEDIKANYDSETPFIVERYPNFSTDYLVENKEHCQKIKAIFYPPQKSLKMSQECMELNSEDVKKPLEEDLFKTEPFYFYVLLNDTTLTKSNIRTIRRIIEEQKPAHTSYNLMVLDPMFYLDMHTYLGVNTVLNKQESEFVIGETMIGRNSILADKEHAGQLGVRSGTGIDTNQTSNQSIK